MAAAIGRLAAAGRPPRVRNRGWPHASAGSGGSAVGRRQRESLTSARLWLGIWHFIVAAGVRVPGAMAGLLSKRASFVELDAHRSVPGPAHRRVPGPRGSGIGSRATKLTAALGLRPGALARWRNRKYPIPSFVMAQITMRSPPWSQLSAAGAERFRRRSRRTGMQRADAQRQAKWRRRPGPALPLDGAGRAAARPAADARRGQKLSPQERAGRASSKSRNNCHPKRKPKCAALAEIPEPAAETKRIAARPPVATARPPAPAPLPRQCPTTRRRSIHRNPSPLPQRLPPGLSCQLSCQLSGPSLPTERY